uniref:Adenine deaminase n=1 Tax=candidate division WOR-3 bacterium TaxID=2052148 RepID=A0A7C4UCU5_UNCW3
MRIKEIIPVSLEKEPADIILKNCKIVNVFSGEIEEGNIALFRKRIAGIGDYKYGKKIIDIKGKYVCPGFIDAHLHIESSMLTPVEFAKVVLPRGTTTIIADPHEIANVLGLSGVEYIIKGTEGIPLNIYITLPSAVPATDLETSGARLGVEDMIGFLEKHPRILALGEVMNYPGVLSCDNELVAKIELLRHRYKKIDGHAPGLTGKKLNAYIVAFIRSDHESISKEEALEKVSKGMQVFIREGSAAKNLDELLKAVNILNHHYFSFCTDDRSPEDIINEGHIDYMVRRAIKKGINPVIAIRMASINTARYFNLRSMGAIAPGYKADFVILKDIKDFKIEMVIKDSIIVSKDNELCIDIKSDGFEVMKNPMFTPLIKKEDLRIKNENGKIRVIEIIKDNIITKAVIMEPKIKDGYVISDPARDIVKVVVVERYNGKNFSKGFIKGLGLKEGAIGTSVGHDAHNIAITGVNDDDIMTALREIKRLNGGIVVVKNGKVISSISLPIAGLMSDKSIDYVYKRTIELKNAAKSLGCKFEPFLPLSFIQLPVIPEIRITDKGIVDVEKQEFLPLFVKY